MRGAARGMGGCPSRAFFLAGPVAPDGERCPDKWHLAHHDVPSDRFAPGTKLLY